MLIITVTAAVVLVVLAALLALVAIAVRAEERCPGSIARPAPGRLARAARGVNGLYVHHAAPHGRYSGPALRHEGR
jgi:hypothetical protein